VNIEPLLSNRQMRHSIRYMQWNLHDLNVCTGVHLKSNENRGLGSWIWKDVGQRR
jgi:hypothetical protein